jgi:hypothetical protein
MILEIMNIQLYLLITFAAHAAYSLISVYFYPFQLHQFCSLLEANGYKEHRICLNVRTLLVLGPLFYELKT